jgi:hypothetical protein
MVDASHQNCPESITFDLGGFKGTMPFSLSAEAKDSLSCLEEGQNVGHSLQKVPHTGHLQSRIPRRV